jgi:hypothetical protein
MRPLFQRIIALLLISAACVTYVDCQNPVSKYPSNLIKYIEPPKVINLQNVDPESAYQMKMQNSPLPAFTRMVIPDLGRMSTVPRSINQDANDSSVVSIANFTQGFIPSPMSPDIAPKLPNNITNNRTNESSINNVAPKKTADRALNVTEIMNLVHLHPRNQTA